MKHNKALYLSIFISVLASFPAMGGSLPGGVGVVPMRAGASAEAPSPGAYVNDPAGVLDAEMVEKLNGVLAGLDAQAKAQVAVLVVDSLGGADIETYAVETYKKWGIGDKRTSRGVLLLAAVRDRKVRIEVGYGLEGILPDGLTGAIQDKYIIPYFRKGDYSGGIYQGSLAIAGIIARDSGIGISEGAVQRGPRNTAPLSAGRKIFSFILFVLFVIIAIRHPFLLFFLLNSGGARSYGGFGGGGFGGFGGGMSGGGGSSRSW